MQHQLDYIFQKEIKQIFELFIRLFRIKQSFSSADHKGVLTGGPTCRYCSLLRSKLGFESTCKKLDYQKQLESLAEKKLLCYTCHGGMTEAVLPVFTADKHIGYIMIGQFRSTHQMPEDIRTAWQKKFGNDALYKAFLKTPCYNAEKTENILTLFSLLVEHIVNKNLIMKGNTSSIMRLISYIKDHPEINISIEEAAHTLNCSVSYLTHNFHQTTGQSFKEYMIRRKLDKADELLASNKSLKIYEISRSVGYPDPFTFSRIYKKYRGYPPSKNKSQSI